MTISIAKEAARIAEKFEREVGRSARWRVVVNMPRKCTARGGRTALAENYVAGFGDLEEKKKSSGSEARHRPTWLKIAAAFSHYSYASSMGNFVLCGLQGGVRKDQNGRASELILVEPTIVSKTKGRWGCRDGGKKDMESFFERRHVCSEFCEWMPLPGSREACFRPDDNCMVFSPAS